MEDANLKEEKEEYTAECPQEAEEEVEVEEKEKEEEKGQVEGQGEEKNTKKKDSVFRFDDGFEVDYDLPPDESFAKDLVPDEEGYKPITWTQLKRSFAYERDAHKYKLFGDISQKDTKHWDRCKQIKIRDTEGVEGAVFFYCDATEPYYVEEDLQVGNRIVVKSPRFHRFMDKQEGMRVEEACKVSRVIKEKYTDESRIDYGTLNKNNGNKKYEEGKYEDAVQLYETAINHLRGTFHEKPEHEQKAKELVATCYLNIAACHLAEKKYYFVEEPCDNALRINATKILSAKAHFRRGQALSRLKQLKPAEESLRRALDLMPGDPKIIEEINELEKSRREEMEAEKKLFKENLEKKNQGRKFGLRKRLLGPANPEKLETVCNFRDAGGMLLVRHGAIFRLKKNLLYRSGSLSTITKSELNILSEDLGIKTIVDLRTQREINFSKKKYAKLAKKKGLAIADYTTFFVPIQVTCKAGKPASLKIPSKKKIDDLLEGPVAFQIDPVSRTVLSLASWVTWCWIMLLGALFLIRQASRYLIQNTVVRVGVVEFYKAALTKQGPELAKILEIVAEKENHPILVCCSIGKDRTGIVISLIQALCGVSSNDVAQDYAKTTTLIFEEFKEAQLDMGMTKEWNVAKPETMQEVLNWIKDEHGSVEKYVKSIGVSEETIKKLRENLCESVGNA